MKKLMAIYWSCMLFILGAEAYKAMYFWTHRTRYADLIGGWVGFMNLVLGFMTMLLLPIALLCLAIAAFKHQGARGRYVAIGFGSLLAIVLTIQLSGLILEASSK